MGRPYCITRCRYRIYPTIGTCHSPLDIVDDLMREHPFDHRDVESIRVGLPERGVPHVTSISRPHDVISAQASLGYSLGVRLVKGGNSLEMYINPELWRDPDVLAVADKLQAYPVVKESQPRYTRLEIKLKNGKVLEGELGYTRGSEELPFSDEVIENKFRGLAEVLLPKDRVEEIIQTVARLEHVSSLTQLVAMLQKP